LNYIQYNHKGETDKQYSITVREEKGQELGTQQIYFLKKDSSFDTTNARRKDISPVQINDSTIEYRGLLLPFIPVVKRMQLNEGKLGNYEVYIDDTFRDTTIGGLHIKRGAVILINYIDHDSFDVKDLKLYYDIDRKLFLKTLWYNHSTDQYILLDELVATSL
jgi:hypothetical protein